MISAGTSWGSTRDASRDSVCHDAGQVYLNGSVAKKIKISRLTDELQYRHRNVTIKLVLSRCDA